MHAVHDEANERWRDPDSCWDTDGWRNRRWFSPEAARPLLKKGQGVILDAMLSVPPERRPVRLLLLLLVLLLLLLLLISPLPPPPPPRTHSVWDRD